jgi:hypothetical protein
MTEYCIWNEDKDGMWWTDCDQFSDGTPTENSFGGNRSEMEKTTRIVEKIWDDAGHEEEPEDPDFYPAPEPTYAERQAQWVKENNVKAGTKVRVIRTFTSGEDGCNIPFTPVKGTFIGDDCTVDAVREHDARITVRSKQKDDWWYFPYFVLEVIKEPTYRPFKNAEEFKPYREKWLRYKHNIYAPSYEAFRPFRYSDDDIQLLKLLTWEQAFNDVIFEDGTPFGIKEEA